jgi:predicted transcriptional regulator
MTSAIVRYGLTALAVAMTVSLVAAAPVLATTPTGTFGDDTDGSDDGTSGTDGSLLTDSTNSSDGPDDSDGSTGSSDGADDGSASDDSTDGSEASTSGESTADADGSSGDAADSDDVRWLADQLTEPADATVAATDQARTRNVLSVDTLDAALLAQGEGPDDTADDVEDAADTVESTAHGAVSDLESTTDTVVRSLTGETDGVLESSTVSEPPRTQAGMATRGAEADRSVAAPSANVPGNDGSQGLPPGPTSGLAVGLGAVAVGAAVRKGALAPGVVANIGSVFSTAGLAPLLGRSSLLDRLVRVLAPLRYSRYDDSDPLEHEARSEVFEIVETTPGAYLSEVADRADLPLSTARHHVRVLEREDLVSGAKVRGKRRFYPAYTNGLELAAAMNDDSTASVLDAIARLGAASVSDLANDLGRDPSTISHHLQRLEEDGIIVRERDGRAVMNKLSPDARAVLVRESGEATVAEAGEAMASD